MFGRLGIILFVCLSTAVLAFAGSGRAQEPAPAQAQEPKSGELLLQENCQSCHDLRPIQTSALDADGWTKTIAAMIEDNGAEVDPAAIPELVRYLSIYHGPVPDGPGKEILLNTCTMCHDLQRIKFGRRSGLEWEETLISMLNEGAPLSDEEFEVVHHYLSRSFGVD
jgi:cytochrome c5